MNLKKLGVISIAFAMLIGGLFVHNVYANPDATITAATGGGAVLIDTTSNGGTGSWTTLTGPVIAEGAAIDIGVGTHTISLPAGWEFNTNQDVTIGITGSETQIALESTTITPGINTISFTVDSASITNPSTLTFNNVQVRPTGTTPGTVNITKSAGTIEGVTNGTTSFGELTTVAGAVTQLVITDQPTDTVYGSDISNVIVKTQDQFENDSTSGLGGEETVTIAIASGIGTLTGTTTGNITSGTLTFDDLKITDEIGAHTLTVSHDTYTSDTSDSFNVTAKPITTVAITVNDREYDGTITAEIASAVPGLDIEGDDDVSIDDSGATATFNQKTIGENIAINATGLVLAGTDADLYTFASGTASTTAAITQKALTVTAPQVTKTYDGTTDVSETEEATVGTLASGDAVSTDPTLTFNTKNVTATTVTPSGIVIKDGAGEGVDMTANYDITYTPNAASIITQRDITVTAQTDTKTYNGDDTSSVLPLRTLGDLAAGDIAIFAQTFDTASAGTGKTLTPEVTSILDDEAEPADMAGNYNVTLINNTTGVIEQKELTITNASVTAKTYDGDNDAVIAGATLSGVVAGDAALVTLGSHEAGIFDSKNAGTQSVSTLPMTISGDASPNYYLTQPTLTGTINTKAITITAVTDIKIYDGTTSSSGTPTLTAGTLVDGDTATYTQTFASKSAGSINLNPSVTIIDAGSENMTSNYDVTETSESGTINQKTLTVTALEFTRVYNGTTTAVEGDSSVTGLVDGDSVSSGPTLTFNSKVIGTNKTVTPSAIAITDGSENMTANYNIGYVPNSTSSITVKTLTVISATVTAKTYDENTAAVIAGATLSGVEDGDTVTFVVDTDTVGVFNNKNVGTDKPVTTSMAIEGADSGNYTLTQPTLTGTINVKAINVTAQTDTKVYDGDNSSAVSPEGDDLEGTDAYTSHGTQTFDSKNVGTEKTLTPSGAVINDGNGGNNYDITYVTDATGVITAKDLALSNLTAANKVYDGTTDVVGTYDFDDDRLGSDDLEFSYTIAFADDNVNTGIAVNLTGISISGGTDASNYNLTTGSLGTTANITERNLTLSNFVADDKTYDGSTAVTGDGFDDDRIEGDILTFSYTVVFEDEDAAVGKTVNYTSIVISGGDDAGNYNLVTTTSTATATITPLDTTGSFTVEPTKVYDGGVSAVIVNTTVTEKIGEDAVVLEGTAEYSDKHVGDGKTVTLESATLTGVDAGNYNLGVVSDMTANITARAITVTAGTDTKVYDGDTTSDGASLVTAGELQTGDTIAAITQTYDNRNVGTGKTLTASGIVSDGNSGNNYILTLATNATGEITARPITVTAATDTKVYDDNTSSDGVPIVTGGTLVDGDVISAMTQTYVTKDVGSTKTINAAGVVTDGNSGNNYTVTFTPNSTGIIRHGSAASFTVTPSLLTPTTADTLNVVVTALDAFGNTVDGGNGATAFTGIVFLTTDAIAPAWYNQVGNITTGGTKTFTSSIKFQTVESGVTISAENSGASVTGTSDAITVTQGGDVTPPTVSAQSPTIGSTGRPITVNPFVEFSEAMDSTTLTPSNVKLCLVSEEEACTTEISASVVVLDGATRARIEPDSNLDYNTGYWIYVGTGVKDVAGNELAEAYGSTTESQFTTAAEGVVTLAVTEIERTETWAYATGEYADGWEWIFHITVPTDETELKMRFKNWTSGSNTILAADNIRYMSNEAVSSDWVDVAAAEVYPTTAITLNDDLYPNTAGRQIQVVVQARIPEGSAGGSYSTSYQVSAEEPE